MVFYATRAFDGKYICFYMLYALSFPTSDAKRSEAPRFASEKSAQKRIGRQEARQCKLNQQKKDCT
jgi:hypothetical protein